MAAMAPSKRTLALFDIDGTLTPARKTISPEMRAFMQTLRGKITVGVVGGSDFPKQKEQLGEDVTSQFDYAFSENGLMAFKGETLIGQESFAAKIGEDELQKLINWVLAYLSKITLPVKRGTFIEFRTGMLNISPVGRNCSREERNAFEEYDLKAGVRKAMVAAMQAEFAHLNLTFSIGGQISFDVFPKGWDKTFCLKFLEPGLFDEVHFFGDKTFEGGNDFEIFSHPDVKGHTVVSPEDTKAQCTALFL
jgi:phosphomannomutase